MVRILSIVKGLRIGGNTELLFISEFKSGCSGGRIDGVHLPGNRLSHPATFRPA